MKHGLKNDEISGTKPKQKRILIFTRPIQNAYALGCVSRTWQQPGQQHLPIAPFNSDLTEITDQTDGAHAGRGST